MDSGECVRALRRSGFARSSAKSCFLFNAVSQCNSIVDYIGIAYDLSSRIWGSHCSPGSGIDVGAGFTLLDGMRPSDGGGTPAETGVAMRLASWLPGLGGKTGGVAPCSSDAKLAIIIIACPRSVWQIFLINGK